MTTRERKTDEITITTLEPKTDGITMTTLESKTDGSSLMPTSTHESKSADDYPGAPCDKNSRMARREPKLEDFFTISLESVHCEASNADSDQKLTPIMLQGSTTQEIDTKCFHRDIPETNTDGAVIDDVLKPDYTGDKSSPPCCEMKASVISCKVDVVKDDDGRPCVISYNISSADSISLPSDAVITRAHATKLDSSIPDVANFKVAIAENQDTLDSEEALISCPKEGPVVATLNVKCPNIAKCDCHITIDLIKALPSNTAVTMDGCMNDEAVKADMAAEREEMSSRGNLKERDDVTTCEVNNEEPNNEDLMRKIIRQMEVPI